MLLNEVHSNYCKRVCVLQNFRLTLLTSRVTFTPLTFCVSRDLKFSQSQFQAAELNWWEFNTKSQTKSAPKLVPIFTLNLNSGISYFLMCFLKPTIELLSPI